MVPSHPATPRRILLLVACATLMPALPRSAVSVSAAPPAALTISPASVTVPFSAEPQTRAISLTNASDASQTAELRLVDVQRADSSHVAFAAPQAGSAAGWVSLEAPSLTLPPHGSGTVTLTVSVPASADAGEHQTALLVSLPPATAAGQITVGEAAVVPLFLEGPGPVVERVDLAGSPDVPGLLQGGPLQLSVTVANHGTVHADLSGRRRLTASVGGHEVVFPEVQLARGEQRVLSAAVADLPLLCICTVTVQLTAADGSVITASSRLVVLPAFALPLLVVMVLLAVVAMVVLRRRRRGVTS